MRSSTGKVLDNMHTISSVLAKALIDPGAVSQLGIPESQLAFLNSNSVQSEELQQIPLTHLNELLSLIQQRLGSEDIGLLAYGKAHPGNLGVLGYAIMSSSTVHNALKCIAEFYPVVGTGYCIYLEDHPAAVRFVGVSADDSWPALPRVFIDAIASITLGLLHWLTPASRFMPILAEFTYPIPKDTRQLKAMFGPNLVFSAAVNALTFSRRDTALTIATSDASLQHIHHEYLTRKKRDLTSNGIIERVKSIVLQHLHQSKPLVIEEISRSMYLSASQLTRSLEIAGERFQMLVDEVRLQYSHHLLTNTALSFKQVSYSVGFKSQSALNKACYRWFGMSPGRYRLSRR